MRRSLNQFTYTPRVLKDLGKQRSVTIPGQSQSLKQILAQHSRGMPLPPDSKGQYFGELDVPDFEEMDLTDLMEYTRDLRDDIHDMTENLRKAEARAREAKTTQKPDVQAVTESTI